MTSHQQHPATAGNPRGVTSMATGQLSNQASDSGSSRQADASTATSASPPPEAQSLTQAETKFREVLQTPYDSVFELSRDGTEYVKPAPLRGTPVAKITEDSPYWEDDWLSLEDFLSREEEEDTLKFQSRNRRHLKPEDKAVQKECKFHQDNMSKHRKIRQIFGPGTGYHPNQLLSKHHFPPEGLCNMEHMYRLACKVSDLDVLRRKGLLAMDPWDFLRWRVSLKVKERLRFPGDSAKSFIKSIVLRLCDEDGDGNPNPYLDPIMRKAAMKAAMFQNRLGSYKRSGGRRASGVSGVSSVAPQRSGPKARKAAADAARVDAREAARRERRAREAARPSVYQGVNAFRAGRQARAGEEF